MVRLPQNGLQGAAKIADRLSVALHEAGDERSSLEAAARASWYEQRANDPEIIRETGRIQVAATQDDSAYWIADLT